MGQEVICQNFVEVFVYLFTSLNIITCKSIKVYRSDLNHRWNFVGWFEWQVSLLLGWRTSLRDPVSFEGRSKTDRVPKRSTVLEHILYDTSTEVIPTCDEKVAFADIDAAFLVGAMPRREGMERKDLLAANIKIFKSQGAALDSVAKKTVKVVVVGNPANTNALICSKYAPSIPKENFSCLTRLDQNRAQAQVSGSNVSYKCMPVGNICSVSDICQMFFSVFVYLKMLPSG